MTDPAPWLDGAHVVRPFSLQITDHGRYLVKFSVATKLFKRSRRPRQIQVNAPDNLWQLVDRPLKDVVMVKCGQLASQKEESADWRLPVIGGVIGFIAIIVLVRLGIRARRQSGYEQLAKRDFQE